MTQRISYREDTPKTHTLQRMEKMLGARGVSGLPHVRCLEDILRDYQASIDDLPLDEVHRIHARIFQATPLHHCLELLLASARSPTQAFQEVLDQIKLQDLVESPRVLGSHLALASHWESAKETQRSAALFGLLLRLGLASGNEELIARSSARLDVLLRNQPCLASVSMEHDQVDQLRRSWRLWGASQHTNHPRMLAQLAEHYRRDEAPTQDRVLGEIAIWERLLRDEGRAGITPSQRSRTLLRLIELYHKVAPNILEVARRGLDLLPRWAAACRHRPALPVQTWSLLEYAADFERHLRQAGSTNSRVTLDDRLTQVYRLLSQRWSREMAVGQLCLWLGQIRRQRMGDRLDPEMLASTAQLLRQAERCTRDPQLQMQLRGDCYRVLSNWLMLGERDARRMATEMLAEYPEESENPEVVLQRAQMLLSIPGTDRQRTTYAQQCRRLAKNALRESRRQDNHSWIAQAQLLRSRACMVLNRRQPKPKALWNALAWLQEALSLLSAKLKRHRTSEDRTLMAEAHMTRALIAAQNSELLAGINRSSFAEQALRNARTAMRLFKAMECNLRAAETMWVQYQALRKIDGFQNQVHYEEARNTLFDALDLLEQHSHASRYKGIHVQQGTLFDNLRGDYLQLRMCQPSQPKQAVDRGEFAPQGLDSISLDKMHPHLTHFYESTPKMYTTPEPSYVT